MNRTTAGPPAIRLHCGNQRLCKGTEYVAIDKTVLGSRTQFMYLCMTNLEAQKLLVRCRKQTFHGADKNKLTTTLGSISHLPWRRRKIIACNLACYLIPDLWPEKYPTSTYSSTKFQGQTFGSHGLLFLPRKGVYTGLGKCNVKSLISLCWHRMLVCSRLQSAAFQFIHNR